MTNTAEDNNVEEQPIRTVDALSDFSANKRGAFISNITKRNWSAYSLDFAVVLVLVVLGLFIRILLSYTFREQYGYGSEIIWDRWLHFDIYNYELNQFVRIRGFADFGYYYRSWIEGWYDGTWYPYQWHEEPGVLDFYSYPPVFIYFLVIAWRPGMSNLWMAMPMILADAACAGVVYLILKELFKGKKGRAIGLVGGILMMIAPINIIYDGIYWLNPGPVTLITMIAFYFATKKKWWQAFFWLAVATMTKQNALFFTYPLFMVMLGEKVKNKKIKDAIVESLMNALLFVGVGLLLSVPWIFVSPYQYIRHMLFPGRPMELRFTPVDPASNDCVSLAKSLQELGFPDWILAITSFGNYSMLLMILSASVIVVLMLRRSFNGKMDGIEFYEWIAIYMIFSHIFMPRGVYKFYTAYFTPVILIAFLGSLAKLTEKKELLPIGLVMGSALFLGFNIWLIVIPRFPVPFLLFMTAVVIALLLWLRAYFRDLAVKKGNLINTAYNLDKRIGH